MTDNVVDLSKRRRAKHQISPPEMVELEADLLGKLIDDAIDGVRRITELEKEKTSLQEINVLQGSEINYLRLIISTIIACGDAMTKEQRASVAAALKDVARRYSR